MKDDPTPGRRDWRIPDERWDRIAPWLPPRQPHPLGCPRPRVDDRQALEAIFFVLRTGCQRKARQETGRCSSSSAHRRFQEGAEAGVFVTWWKMGRADYAALHGMDWEWLAMDGAMTNAPLGGKQVGKNPTDRGKLGTKRRGRTDGGVPIGLAGEGANRHDVKMTRETLESIPVKRPQPTPDTPQGMGLDTGYDYEEVRALLAEFGFTAHSRAQGEEAKALKQETGFRARRWVVERTHSWMHRFRRVLIRWDKQVRNDVAFLYLACASIPYRQSGLLG